MTDDLFDIKGKCAVISGASSGIGKELALLYASHGCNVVILARRKDRLFALADQLKQECSVNVLPIVCDVTDEKMLSDAINETACSFGRIDILVNNAGTTEKSEDISTHSRQQWDNVINTNLTSAYIACRECARVMKRQRYGRIINISSITGIMGLRNQVSYAASKGALISMTKAIAVELGPYNITVNSIAPGYIYTELTNPQSAGCKYFKSRTVLDRIGNTEDLRGIALLLASDASSYITGTVIPVDGGILANI